VQQTVPSLQRAVFEICAGIIAGPLPTALEVPARDTLITTRWPHHELHEVVPALPVHIVATYYGAPASRTWRCGQMQLSGTGRPGDIAVIPAGLGGRWDIHGESSVSYVLLSDTRLQGVAEPFARGGRVELAPCLAEPDPVAARLLRALGREAANPNPAGQLLVEQALDLLCMHLLRAHSSSSRTPAPAPRHGLPSWQVRRVTAYMAERLDQNIGLDELAALTSLSRSYFCTMFRHATGSSPHEWLTGLRLERARQLLRNPNARITDIALAIGYQTPSAFTAAFRRHIGATPSDYRRCL
jgi:AraC family transcriptional regulator